MKISKCMYFFTLSLILFTNCKVWIKDFTKGDICECDSINDYSGPYNFTTDIDGNLVSRIKKTEFAHCMMISNKKVKKYNQIYYPLSINNEIVGYILKYSNRFNYVNCKFKNEELLFYFERKDSIWDIKHGYFQNYRVRTQEDSYKSDSIFTFQFEYFGDTQFDESFFHYKKIVITKRKILMIELTNGIKCSNINQNDSDN